MFLGVSHILWKNHRISTFLCRIAKPLTTIQQVTKPQQRYQRTTITQYINTKKYIIQSKNHKIFNTQYISPLSSPISISSAHSESVSRCPLSNPSTHLQITKVPPLIKHPSRILIQKLCNGSKILIVKRHIIRIRGRRKLRYPRHIRRLLARRCRNCSGSWSRMRRPGE